MRARGIVMLLPQVVALAIAAGCGGNADALRIGVLTDCNAPPFSINHQRTLAGAELPLIRRGARLQGSKPSDGLDGAAVAGRPVRLVIGCENSMNPASTLGQ